MKGKIEGTIPQRQFENIKITYEFNSLEEKEKACQAIISDLIKYHHEVSRRTINNPERGL